jgi:glycolate oxidase FAD binding subunit
VPRNEFRTLDLPMADELGRRGGIRPRVRPQECASYDIAGVVPKLVFSPRTVAEASKTVALLAQEGATIVIRGAGTKQSRPPAPPDVEVVLDSTRCRGIVDYVPADLTVRVAVGTRFAELQETLRANHQFFPVDPPFAAECTIGGILSSGTSGALRQYYGSPRDSVLGMRVCLSDGSVAFTGAKVVKSVAGYDIAKLFVGSLGTLGFIGEVVLKVAPLPAEQRAVYALFTRVSDACAAAAEIVTAGLFPLATVALDPRAHRRVRALDAPADDSWALIVRFGGSVAGLRAMTDGAAKLSATHGSRSVEVLDHDRTLFAWSDIAELAGGERYLATQSLTGKLACLPSQVADVCSFTSNHFSNAELVAHPASGVVFVRVDVEQQADVAGSLDSLWSECRTRATSLEWLSAPPVLGASLRQPVPDTAPLLLMRRVKAALDPTGTFDPGRFLGGI